MVSMPEFAMSYYGHQTRIKKAIGITLVSYRKVQFMPQQPAAACGLADRWTALTQARLEYLTNLFESGRWRRFYSEADLLENIREAKVAVETWRGLSTGEASLDNSGPSLSALGRPQQNSRRPLPNGWLKIVAADERNDA
jgi:hypothetical protein